VDAKQTGNKYVYELLALMMLETPMKKLIQKGADVNMIVDVSGEPLYFYLMKTLPLTDAGLDIIELVLEHADMTIMQDIASKVADVVSNQNFPTSIIKTLLSKGLPLFQRDENGYSLRDRIYLQYFQEEPEVLSYSLRFANQLIINIATDGDIGFLERLILDSYELDDVQDKDGFPIFEVAVRDGNEKMAEYLAEVPSLQVSLINIIIFM